MTAPSSGSQRPVAKHHSSIWPIHASTCASAVSQGALLLLLPLDGARWVTLEGPVRVLDDATAVEAAVAAYARRYRQPRERDDRVVIEIEVDRMMCNSGLR